MFIPDAIHHRYANVFYGPQQVFVGNEISRERRILSFKLCFWHLQTALLLVPLMSWERWSRKTASTLKSLRKVSELIEK